MNNADKASRVLTGLAAGFLGLGLVLLLNLWGHPPPLYPIPLVALEFTRRLRVDL